jgi:hypothetical protein
VQFLAATPKAYTAAKVHPDLPDPPAHDAFTRLLHRLEPDPEALVAGIDLVTLHWTDGDRNVPCDDRLYDEADEPTENDHFAATVAAARARGFRPRCVAFDGWSNSLHDLKRIGSPGWTWPTRLESDRLIDFDRRGAKAVGATAVAAAGTEVWLPGFGSVEVFGIVAPNGDTAYRATDDPAMTSLERVRVADSSRAIGHDHRGVEPCTGIERWGCRSARAQPNPTGLALRAFLRLEVHCFARGVSWVEAKGSVVRDAVRACLDQPHFRLPRVLTA